MSVHRLKIIPQIFLSSSQTPSLDAHLLVVSIKSHLHCKPFHKNHFKHFFTAVTAFDFWPLICFCTAKQIQYNYFKTITDISLNNPETVCSSPSVAVSALYKVAVVSPLLDTFKTCLLLGGLSSCLFLSNTAMAVVCHWWLKAFSSTSM